MLLKNFAKANYLKQYKKYEQNFLICIKLIILTKNTNT